MTEAITTNSTTRWPQGGWALAITLWASLVCPSEQGPLPRVAGAGEPPQQQFPALAWASPAAPAGHWGEPSSWEAPSVGPASLSGPALCSALLLMYVLTNVMI